ncbi:MAG: 16S rRNA (cytosine(1402)-N(4))-methyltransferase RsmH [Moorellales bacterium]
MSLWPRSWGPCDLTERGHVPVLLEAVVQALDPRPAGVYVDATVGAGGHSRAILERLGPEGKLIGLDRDSQALALATERLAAFSGRVVLVQADFRDLARVVREAGADQVDGVLFDLGVSSLQLDTAERGFSYWQEAPLDMRLDPTRGITAAELVNRSSREELARLIARYGEERWAGRIAEAIVRHRRRQPIRTTTQLAAVVKEAIPASARRHGPHPARRTFQALRIAVNQELESLERGLAQALEILRPGGRLVVISFHSLEDRTVKTFFRNQSQGCTCPPSLPACVCGRRPVLKVLTRSAIRPTPEEVARNPRARSARLRAAEKLGSSGGLA